MKILSFIFILTLSISAFAGKFEIDISGMSCGMCVESITKELKALNKVENITVSLEEKKARFAEIKDRKVTDVEIKVAIKKAGYEATKIRRN